MHLSDRQIALKVCLKDVERASLVTDTCICSFLKINEKESNNKKLLINVLIEISNSWVVMMMN